MKTPRSARATECGKLKKSYGKEYKGVVRTTFLIHPDGNISYIWNNVKVPGHAKAVHDFIKKNPCRPAP